ncbi:coiled-coil-helix-coiled-coil-helix domain-containing protein 5-like isoform X1 [Anneissia japonica]|uniref:coiled-coil-helix-coiled-coil-helix domain-containing protein 5-like isoform X1 n=1 Tax=Anneissia japonica TaxID=1529436 RepID=UPI00142587B0|nr:coiled-coil-helix-coiled-coil-helix domain-containing protein 5-like isoform X1 [Anneissia japonica]
MEAIVNIITKYCGEELDNYGRCVTENPSSWQNDCDDLKNKATHCSSQHPAVKRINRECANSFKEYDTCLNTHPQDVQQCVSQLEEFLKCAERSSQRIENAVLEKSEIR